VVKIKKIKDFKINESISLDDLDDLNDVFIDLIDFGFETDNFDQNKFERWRDLSGIKITLKKIISGAFDFREIETEYYFLYGSTNIKLLKEEMDKTLDHLSEINSKLKSLGYKFAFDFEISCEDNYTIWIHFRISK
jgi:hypothetical protein